MTKLIPLENHVLVKPLEEEKKTKSGIILPDSKEKPERGEVVAVGPGKMLENGSRAAIDVKEWDVVYFTKYAPDEIEINGEKMLVIQDKSLLAKEG